MLKPYALRLPTATATGTTSFRGRTIIVLFLYVILVFWLFYPKFVTTFPTGSAGRNLTCWFNPVSVVIPTLRVVCYN